MSTQQTAISPERLQKAFAEGLTFEQFVDQAEVNQERLQTNFKGFALNDEERAYFAAWAEPVDVLVLAHDWCGDVVSNLPLFAKIEQETGKLKLHILNRDPDNLDIAELYPHPDGKSHIPTYVFFNDKGEEQGIFIERPEQITALFPTWGAQFWDLNPELEGRNQAIAELDPAVKQAYYKYLLSQRADTKDVEKQGIISIIQSIVK
ncbi:thioredoxin family protein [Paenibacillus agri]|uniref:Thioredoxin family protein n=1 Tax=Paenibacillus agri TaxID=2744309 RepID=A0A850EUA6_9BACL|nr:thioredoxin family protein [Paenibacillus agri]NUU64435.1 thioredoxin family protein [Paenibacillus agri]